MIDAPFWQAPVFAVFAVMALALNLTFEPSLTQQLLLLAPMVAVLGLPHGALDLPIAEFVWPLEGWRGKFRFGAIYLGLAAGLIVVWIFMPSIALFTFLAYSTLHFSGDWAGSGALLRLSGGASTIGAPAIFHHQDVVELFATLAPPAAAHFSANAAAVFGGAGFSLFIFTVVFQPQSRNRAAFEQAVLWSAGYLLPPLLFFAVYFCGLHSIRHFYATIRLVPQAKRALAIATVLSMLVVVASGFFVQTQILSTPDALPQTMMQVIFIGLAALTVPHMLLVDRFMRLRNISGKLTNPDRDKSL